MTEEEIETAALEMAWWEVPGPKLMPGGFGHELPGFTWEPDEAKVAEHKEELRRQQKEWKARRDAKDDPEGTGEGTDG